MPELNGEGWVKDQQPSWKLTKSRVLLYLCDTGGIYGPNNILPRTHYNIVVSANAANSVGDLLIVELDTHTDTCGVCGGGVGARARVCIRRHEALQ